MRSFVTLTALAAIGGLNLVSASPCHPHSSSALSTTHSDSSSTVDDSYSGSTPSATTTQSNTAPATTTKPNDVSTTTSAVSASVTNVIDGGSFSGPNDKSFSGDYTVDQTNGYRGDGSKDTNCGKISGGGDGGVIKRQDTSPYISQQVNGLDTGGTYTIRFSLALVSSSGVSCTVQASLGSQFFKQTIASGTDINWETYTKEAIALSTSESLTFSFACASSDTVSIYIDSIFMSNKVTPANIDDASLDWGDQVNTGVISTVLGGESRTSTTASPTTTSATTAAFSRPVTRSRIEATLVPSATCPGAVAPTPLATCVSRTPVPSSLTCGVLGVKGWDWWGYAPFVKKSQKSVKDCALLCYQDALNCNAFAYLPDFGGREMCAFGYYSLAEDGLTPGEANTAYTWYDRNCFQCEDCAS